MFIFLILGIALLIYLELQIPQSLIRGLKYKASIDKILYEPGEEIVLRSEVYNYNKSFVPFVRLREYIPAQALLDDDGRGVYYAENWVTVERKVPIRARERLTKNEVFTINSRGRYSFGEYKLGVGDIFGWNEAEILGKGPHSFAVMPERSRNADLSAIVSGFIGDISVMRFIMEDPILTVGFDDYTGREPMKDISWMRTAMAGKLLVKKYDHTGDINVTVLLNCDGDGNEDLEECFRITRMVVEKLEVAHIPYAFKTNGFLFGPVSYVTYVPKGLGEAHLREILYGLSTAIYDRMSSFTTLVDDVLDKREQNENYMVITRELDAAGHAALRKLQRSCDGKIGIIVGKEAKM